MARVFVHDGVRRARPVFIWSISHRSTRASSNRSMVASSGRLAVLAWPRWRTTETRCARSRSRRPRLRAVCSPAV